MTKTFASEEAKQVTCEADGIARHQLVARFRPLEIPTSGFTHYVAEGYRRWPEANSALSRRKQGFESPRERHVIASTVAIADFFAVFVVTGSQCLCKSRRFLFSPASWPCRSLPTAEEFMAAYSMALVMIPDSAEIGASRTSPGTIWKNARTARRFNWRRMSTWPAASTSCT